MYVCVRRCGGGHVGSVSGIRMPSDGLRGYVDENLCAGMHSFMRARICICLCRCVRSSVQSWCDVWSVCFWAQAATHGRGASGGRARPCCIARHRCGCFGKALRVTCSLVCLLVRHKPSLGPVGSLLRGRLQKRQVWLRPAPSCVGGVSQVRASCVVSRCRRTHCKDYRFFSAFSAPLVLKLMQRPPSPYRPLPSRPRVRLARSAIV